MSKEIIQVDGKTIKRGENAVINLNIARLPSGTRIDLPIYVFRSKKPGPILLLSAGLHGDEVNGIEIIRQLIAAKTFNELKCGSVIAIPIMNIFGFLNFSREVPDGKDVNRSFPGNKSGSLASRVAYSLTNVVLKEIDYGIDFHTGGASRYNYPQVRFAAIDAKSTELAKAFNAPIRLVSNLIDKSIRKQAYLLGKPLIVYEGGETLRFDEKVIEEGVNGARRVLKHLDMLVFDNLSSNTNDLCTSSSWVRAKKAGLFTSFSKSGATVRKNQVIGKITDPFGHFETNIKATYAGILIGHNNMPVVHQGDALFHIGIKGSLPA
jgi:predicted deacylase